MSERPECVTDSMLEYLDELRESGDTNMYGAGPYLDGAFPELAEGHRGYHSSPKAREVLGYWMRTFEARHAARVAPQRDDQ